MASKMKIIVELKVEKKLPRAFKWEKLSKKKINNGATIKLFLS